MAAVQRSRFFGSVAVCAVLATACASSFGSAAEDDRTSSAATVGSSAASSTETGSETADGVDTANGVESQSTSSSTTIAVTTTPRPEPQAETDPEVLAEFVSEHNGDFELTDSDVSVTDLEAGEDKSNFPADFFVEPDQWRLFQILGLIEPDADPAAVAQHRINTIRGVCCPVQMWNNDDHPLLRSTVIVHELTHLADDSRSYYEDLDEGQFALASREPVSLLGVPIEGNASRVQQLYAAELEADGALPERFVVDWGGPMIPEAMVRVWEFAYVEGQRFMQALFDQGGFDLVDEAFLRPPITSEQVYDVDAYLSNEQALEVPQPEIPDGAELLVSPRSLGSFTLQLLAETEVSPGDAQALATLWAGDTIVAYGTGESWCGSATVVMETDDAAASMADVLADAIADAQVEVAADSLDTITLNRCITSPKNS